MKKKIVKFSMLPLLATTIFYSFSVKDAEADGKFVADKYLISDANICYTVPQAPEHFSVKNSAGKVFPRLDNSYIAFKEAVGFAESSGDYSVINDFGYLGKYQFGRGTLEMIGIKNMQLFLDAPQLQEAAFYANASRNKWILQRDIARFGNKIINGVKITESGILAAAHLAGPGNVKRYLRSFGQNSFSDGFGTSIKYYFRKFAGYDTSFIKPERLARADVKNLFE